MEGFEKCICDIEMNIGKKLQQTTNQIKQILVSLT